VNEKQVKKMFVKQSLTGFLEYSLLCH